MTRSRTLDPGTQIGRYRVVSLLGSGGMGEVYLARDESLDRSVALKILPPDLVKNDERVRRFVQEAKSASSLNHPHIVTIYEIGEVEFAGGDDGASADTIHYIAMELVSGHTLKTLIHQEKTDLRTLVRYLAQAADGLAKAHAAGIVHRDLKPENVMVTSDGFAKVVDFGLAKLTETASSGTDLTSAPTELARATGAGVVLGTIGYMSPEQVQGKTVDHRSDIFSLGCVLYEAATRQRPFQADSDVETLHKILKERPQPIEEINPEVPGELRRVIRRCLAKLPDQRWQGMKDLALELSELADEYDTLSASSGSGTRVSSGVMGEAPASRRMRMVVAAALTIGLLGLAAAVWSVAFRSDPASADPPAATMDIRRVASDPNLLEAVLSPDGQQLALMKTEAGSTSIWIRQVATGSEVRIASDLERVREICFSADGTFLFYMAGDTVFRLPSLGGTPRRVAAGVVNSFAVSPDGQRIAYGRIESDAGFVMLADIERPEPRVLLQELPGDLAWSPDGGTLLVNGAGRLEDMPDTLTFVSVGDGRSEDVTIDELWAFGDPVWVDEDEIVGFGQVIGGEPSAVQLWQLSYPGGRARRLTSDATGFRPPLSASADGRTLVALQQRRTWQLWSARADNLQNGTELHADERRLDVKAITGSSVILNVGGDQLWSVRLDGSALQRLTPEGVRVRIGTVFSPTADAVIFDGVEDGTSYVWRMNSDGSDLRPLTTGMQAEALTADGQAVRFIRLESDDSISMWRVAVAGGEPERVEPRHRTARYSPDERYRFTTDRDGQAYRVVVEPANGGTVVQSWNLAPAPRPQLAWAPTADAVDVVRETDGIANLWRLPLHGGEPRQLTRFSDPGLESFVWSDDGLILYYTRSTFVSRDVVLITNFRQDDGGSP